MLPSETAMHELSIARVLTTSATTGAGIDDWTAALARARTAAAGARP